ncbi:hypothetical protein C8R44DRAFT_989968 [Mycena epipterygia]|nr:hypothetical protein C8R44DRAFT_989968 [Mycena epipterygia]
MQRISCSRFPSTLLHHIATNCRPLSLHSIPRVAASCPSILILPHPTLRSRRYLSRFPRPSEYLFRETSSCRSPLSSLSHTSFASVTRSTSPFPFRRHPLLLSVVPAIPVPCLFCIAPRPSVSVPVPHIHSSASAPLSCLPFIPFRPSISFLSSAPAPPLIPLGLLSFASAPRPPSPSFRPSVAAISRSSPPLSLCLPFPSFDTDSFTELPRPPVPRSSRRIPNKSLKKTQALN